MGDCRPFALGRVSNWVTFSQVFWIFFYVHESRFTF